MQVRMRALSSSPLCDLPAAMDKKARSKQMNHIVERLLRYGEFDVVVFGDDAILNKPVQEWPLCDCLLCWHSGKEARAAWRAGPGSQKPFDGSCSVLGCLTTRYRPSDTLRPAALVVQMASR